MGKHEPKEMQRRANPRRTLRVHGLRAAKWGGGQLVDVSHQGVGEVSRAGANKSGRKASCRHKGRGGRVAKKTKIESCSRYTATLAKQKNNLERDMTDEERERALKVLKDKIATRWPEPVKIFPKFGGWR